MAKAMTSGDRQAGDGINLALSCDASRRYRARLSPFAGSLRAIIDVRVTKRNSLVDVACQNIERNNVAPGVASNNMLCCFMNVTRHGDALRRRICIELWRKGARQNSLVANGGLQAHDENVWRGVIANNKQWRPQRGQANNQIS